MRLRSSQKTSYSNHRLLQMAERHFALLAALATFVINMSVVILCAVLLLSSGYWITTSGVLLCFVAAMLSCVLSGIVAFVAKRTAAIRAEQTHSINSKPAKSAVIGTVQKVEAVVQKPPAHLKSEGSLDNRHWLQLVEECVQLLDELDENKAQFDPSGRELAEHTIARLQELLERSGVEVISTDSTLDRLRHQPVRTTAKVFQGMLIAETISPGFAVGNHVLRRARVRVAEPSSL